MCLFYAILCDFYAIFMRKLKNLKEKFFFHGILSNAYFRMRFIAAEQHGDFKRAKIPQKMCGFFSFPFSFFAKENSLSYHKYIICRRVKYPQFSRARGRFGN